MCSDRMDCLGWHGNHKQTLLTFVLSLLARINIASCFLYSDASSFPVIEYLPGTEKDPEKPSFIYGPNNDVPRVLEFYGNHCPHCNEFHAPYVSFAREITNLANETGLGVIKVYGINCGDHANLCSKFGVTGVPSIHLLAAGATSTTFAIGKKRMHPFIILNRLAVEKDPLVVGNDRIKRNLYDDAYLSFLWTLRKHIFKQQGPLSTTQKKALNDWLELLKKALPPGWKVRRIVNDILSNFMQVVSGEEYLLHILEKHSTPGNDWSEECENDPEGPFQCGLWSLMHIATVGVFEFNYLLDNFMADDIPISAARAAKIIQNFISTFLDCKTDCESMFLAGYEPCGSGRCENLNTEIGEMLDWLQVSIWWLNTRNAVKSKLNGSLESNWPARNDCPDCWHVDRSIKEKSLYKYMRIVYWPDDSTTVKYREDLGVNKSAIPFHLSGREVNSPFRVTERALRANQTRWPTGTKPRGVLVVVALSSLCAWGRRLRMRHLKRIHSK